jgi:hypothetical protein
VNRRVLMALVGGAAAWPLAAHAQKPVMPIIGFLDARLPARAWRLAASSARSPRNCSWLLYLAFEVTP